MSLEVSVADAIGVIELNRPEQLNALTVELAGRLGEAAESAVAAGAKVLILSGRGGTFCAGADLSVVDQALTGDVYAALTPLVAGLHTSIKRLRALPVPIIAAVEGPAVGAGLGLALAADLRVLGEKARLIPGYLGIGASPDGGVSYLLARMLGSARAMSLLVRNRPVTAEEALTLGLAESVAATGEALAAARELATSLLGTPPLAFIRVRELLDRATEHSLAAHLDLEQQRVSELWRTHDFIEGVSAFVQRRKPDFRGD
jgi:2-(1,2-epoxy-1,2-dihydrophenyl)acetyl-CoA isomerase